MRACAGVSAPADSKTSCAVGTTAPAATREQRRTRTAAFVAGPKQRSRPAGPLVQRAVAGAGGNDAVDAVGAQRVDDAAVGVGVAGDDRDPRRARRREHAQAERHAQPATAATASARPPGPRRSTRHRPSRRRRHGRCAVCARPMRRGSSRPARPPRPARRDAAPPHRVDDVLRPVGKQRRRRPHRRRQHDRLVRRQHALQQVGGLLERVGAVGDDDAATSLRSRWYATRSARRRQTA